MIPFFQWTEIPIGPITIQVWGLFVAAGLAAGLLASLWAAKQRSLQKEIVLDGALWIVLASLVGARIVYLLTEWEDASVDSALDFIAIWNGGMSVSGGFLGALLAAVLFLRYKKMPFFPYADVFIFGLPVGLWIGRMGCFFIFDHPGTVTTFFLGQTYLDGVVRHNHGLYLSLNGFAIMILFFIVWRYMHQKPPGTFVALFAMLYGVSRFFLDFFRATDLTAVDTRWLGLTFAQYMSLLLIVVGIGLWYRVRRKRNV